MAWPNGTRLKTFVAGGSHLPADTNNIEDRMLQIAGHRGKSIIATEETRTSTSYGKLTTPDEVTDIVLPVDGLLCFSYEALWKNSVANTGRAAIFLNGNQLKRNIDDSAPAVDEAGGPSGTTYAWLHSAWDGMFGMSNGVANSTGVTTGTIMGHRNSSSADFFGGVCYVVAAAGTYAVSVQFKSTSGNVTVKDRKLRVWTMAFA